MYLMKDYNFLGESFSSLLQMLRSFQDTPDSPLLLRFKI